MDVIWLKPFSIVMAERGQCHGHFHNDYAMEKLFSEHGKLSEIPSLVDSLESGSKFMSIPFKLLLKSTVTSMKNHD